MRSDLQENILSAYERNGQLFAMPVNYLIGTVVAASSQACGISSWTIDEMVDYVNDLLPSSHVFYEHSKSAVLDVCLEANGDAFIDWHNKGMFNRDYL